MWRRGDFRPAAPVAHRHGTRQSCPHLEQPSLSPPHRDENLMLNDVTINWWGVLVATLIVTLLAGLYFTVVIGELYNSAVGRPDDAPPGAGALFIAGPLACNVLTILTSAVLISALGIDELGQALLFGLVVGVGYLTAMVFQIGINPVFARPLFYGLINAPYFILASLVASASLVLIG